MANRVEGCVAIVTGGARGQGSSHGEYLAREGATVVLADVLDDVGEAEAERQRGEGLSVEYAHLDVANPAEWTALVEQVEGQHGKVDVLVNNAGIVRYSSVTDCSDEEWDITIAVNQSGVFYGMRAVIPAMKRAGGGSIINTSSTFGVAGTDGYAGYVASKHAVVGLTRSAAVSYGNDNIRVNAICPGTVLTPMLEEELVENKELVDEMVATQPISRIGLPKDISPAVVYLASQESSYMTGSLLTVDAGWGAQ
jgi:3alpha(or 20beta)-hydroxysteroid dehydrogenase